MPEFFNVLPPEQTLQILLDRLPSAGADGLVQVPLDRAGLYAGEQVVVRLF